MISKELLSEVLNVFVYEVDFIQNNKLYYKFTTIEGSGDYSVDNINIYELAHKCKEWANSKGYCIIQDTRGYTKVSKIGSDKRKFWEDEEYTHERTFNACQWILDNKDK